MLDCTHLFRKGAVIFLLLSSCAQQPKKVSSNLSLPEQKLSPKLAKIRRDVYQLVLNQKFEAAIQLYGAAIELARVERNPQLAVQFLMNIAACFQSISAYREAMQQYKVAIQEAKKIVSIELETVTAMNMASLLLEMGENKGAEDLLREYPLDGSNIPPPGRLSAFLLQINVFTRLKSVDERRSAIRRALDEADREVPKELVTTSGAKQQRWPERARELRRALVFATIAQALTWEDQNAEAEQYALEAFRLRATFQEKARSRDALQLAMIWRYAGQYERASDLIGVARRLDPTNRTPMHLFMLDREEARILLARGDFSEALPPLRNALARARSWRMEVLPSDSAYLNFESYMTKEVHVAFLDTILNPEFSLQQRGVAEESFWVAEEARFASMRAAQFPASEFAKRLPKEYWSRLASFQRLQANSQSASGSSREGLAQLERKLDLMEMEAGLSIPHGKENGTPAVGDWLRNLPAGETVFSYYLSEPFSLAWVANHKGIAVRRIAGRKQLVEWIDKFRAEISDPSQKETSSTGLKLSKQLFGEYLGTNRTTPFWTMVLDQQLSTLPIGALPTGHEDTRYLVEEHSLRVLPSAIFLKRNQEQDWKKTATGIGDPVYNQADARVSLLQNVSADMLQLNRLPASTQELKRSMTVLRGSQWTTEMRTGMSATVGTLRSTLEQSPDILHLSTHFVPQAGNAHLLAIALSPERGGQAVYTALDLNSVRTSTKLVVLSGCSSSTGEIVSSIGINGLSRAFLISGASAVVATLWPTLDSEGPIFPAFYSNLLSRRWSPRAAAEALRAAQLEMIRQGGWTSKPAYWAAYLAISKG